MNSKWIAVLLFVATFLVGAVAGMFVDRALLRTRPFGFRPPAGAPEHGGMMMGHFSRRLDLSPGQQQQLMVILEKYRPRFDEMRRNPPPPYEAVRDSLQNEIRVILTPEQKTKFDQMIAEFESRRQGMRHRPWRQEF